MNQEHLVDYQRKKAQTHRVMKACKKNAWREFCSDISREVKIGDVWLIWKKMSGKRKYTNIPMLEDGEVIVVTDKGKANMLG